MPRVVGWCRACRLRGLDSPVQLYPMGGNEAIKMCSNINCSDEFEGSILSEIVKIDDMTSKDEFEAGPLSVTNNLCDSDEEFDYCCRKASSRNAPVTEKPLGQPSVDISDTTSTAAVGSDPPLFANSSEHEHREGQTSMSTCGDAGQALTTPVVAPIVSMCANPDVCMDADKPTDNVISDSASLCLDSSLFECDEEPWSQIFDSELPCADNMSVDAEKPTDTSNSKLLLADSTVSLVTGESTSNICYNTPGGGSNVCVDKEVNVYMTPQNSVVICDDANRLTAEKEEVGNDIAFCDEQAAIEGVLMDDGSFLSRAASYCSSPTDRREVYSPEGSVVASETQSVGLVKPSQTRHGDDSRTVINHPASSAMPKAIPEPTVVASRISAPGLLEVSLEDRLHDPLEPSLYIAQSMSIIDPQNFVPRGFSAEDLCTNARLTEKISLRSSDLNVKYFTELKGDAGCEGRCLSQTATALDQRPPSSLKRTRSPSPSATSSTTVRPSSHAGGGSGTLQQCMSTGLLLRSTSTLSNKPSSSDVQEDKVKRDRRDCEPIKVTIGTNKTGEAVLLSVKRLQKSVQNVVLKVPSDAATGGNTETAAVHSMNEPASAQNSRTKPQEPVSSTAARKGRKSKTTKKRNKSPLPPNQKVTRTGFAAVDKLNAIYAALAAPMVNESAPKKSKVNARAQKQSGRTCPNKKKRQPKSVQ